MFSIAGQAKFDKFSFGFFEVVGRVIIGVFRAPEFAPAFFKQQFNAPVGTIAVAHGTS
jgi:hypothetical protein